MPNKCCVPACSSNYKTGKTVQVFSFPKDEVLFKKWLRAIPRKDFAPTANNKVCALHFDASCFEHNSSYTDPRTGKFLEIPLKVPRLRHGSVPSLFPVCPSYLSKQSACFSREPPDAKKMRQEASQLARAIEESASSYRNEQMKRSFLSLPELRERLKNTCVPDEWTVIHRPECAMFLNIANAESAPVLQSSVTVSTDLKIAVCFHGSCLKRIGDYVVPEYIRDVKFLLEILDRLQRIASVNNSPNDLADVIVSLLEKIAENVTGSKKDIITFLKEQVVLLGKERLQYSSQTMVLACILHTISPHAYKFL
ncbi:unnamed protein product, partial [Ixodes hexagonus]